MANLPLPKLKCSFEDDGAVHLIMEYIEGVTENQLHSDRRSVVEQKLNFYCKSLHKLRFRAMGGPSELLTTSLLCDLTQSNLKK